MSTIDFCKNRKGRLLVFRQAMAMLSVNLVLCALISGLYRSRLYFSFAASAAGVLLILRAWFSRCRWKDGHRYAARPDRVPYLLRGRQPKRVRKPAFLMNSTDFEDDLTRFTVTGEEDFSDDECWRARILSCLLCGALMIFFSFVL